MLEKGYRDLVVNLASRYLGCATNDTLQRRLVDIYNLYLPHPRGYIPKYTDSWCAIFVSAIAVMANLTNIIPVECGCGEMVNLAKSKGIWKGKVTPQPGDVIMYDNKKDGWADHTGFVEAVNGSGITTIEGNASGGQCVRKTVLLSDGNILGFICPDYASLATAPAVVEKPDGATGYDPSIAGAYYCKEGLKLRIKPNSLFTTPVVGWMKTNDQVIADGYTKDYWYHATWKGIVGWCSSKYLRR